MSRIRFSPLLLAIALAASLGHIPAHAADKRRDATAAKTSASTAGAIAPGQGFEAFQLVVERNIFNPNRTGRTRATTEEKPPRVDEISLVGTMNYEKGLVAFFDSPDSAFRKTVREGESIGDFKVQRITAEGVELVRDEKPVPLKVAQQLRRPEGGDWSVTDTPARAESGASAAGSTRYNPAPVEIPADASEVLKRLMKKRDKQLEGPTDGPEGLKRLLKKTDKQLQ